MTSPMIRGMTRADLDFAAACTQAEGWASETKSEIEALFAHSPSGCFIAEVDRRRVGMCIATAYAGWGFIGELIVLPEVRQRGLGARLLAQASDYLSQGGARAILLDSVPRAMPLYQRAGFKPLCRSLRLRGTPRPRTASTIRCMTEGDLATVLQLDSQAFGGDRSHFIRLRMARHGDLCLVQVAAGRVEGYLLGRMGRGVVTAGPWYARQPGGASPALLEALADRAAGLPLAIGILETSRAAQALAREAGLHELPDPPMRMLAGPAGEWPCDPRLLAIGSPAKG
jgi:predicted N-acetyltransferase YhbS